MEFSDQQLERYARHIILPELGGKGQQKLLDSSVLVVGAGGLGSPLLLYLAAAGVGRIGIVDDDAVDLSNLQRQVIHATGRIGTPKVESAREVLAGINPDVVVETHALRLDASNVSELIGAYDMVADGTDNFATRFLLNDACYLSGVTLVSAALLRFEGQVSTFKAHEGDYPCYRCIFPEPPPDGLIPTCAEGGVLGAVAGMVGCLQATEVIKELAGIGESLAGHLLILDALNMNFRKIKVRPDPACPLCGPNATITDLSIHAHGQDDGQ
ncbi:MAG: molybdopterin-synthase adenylyltransferase MoeB [Alphaproteobacteria bacterium]|nr:molybdopterin-synthase adenylyltransferase MoeB [Alphaproteobacteria bacterium]